MEQDAVEELAAKAAADALDRSPCELECELAGIIAAAIREALREPLAALGNGISTLPDDERGRVYTWREQARATLAKWGGS